MTEANPLISQGSTEASQGLFLGDQDAPGGGGQKDKDVGHGAQPLSPPPTATPQSPLPVPMVFRAFDYYDQGNFGVHTEERCVVYALLYSMGYGVPIDVVSHHAFHACLKLFDTTDFYSRVWLGFKNFLTDDERKALLGPDVSPDFLPYNCEVFEMVRPTGPISRKSRSSQVKPPHEVGG